jgi:hypothetical protein
MSMLGIGVLMVVVTAGAIALLVYSTTCQMCRFGRGHRGVIRRWLTAR